MQKFIYGKNLRRKESCEQKFVQVKIHLRENFSALKFSHLDFDEFPFGMVLFRQNVIAPISHLCETGQGCSGLV
jgi:hypothetical protein